MLFLEDNYIFDPLTLILAKVEPLVEEILRLKTSGKNEEEIKRLMPLGYNPSRIEEALDEIRKYNEEYGLFNVRFPYFSEIKSPFKPEEIREQLENSLCHMVLNVSEDCNMRCTYCKYSEAYPGERVKRQIKMNKETIHRALDFLRSKSRTAEVLRIGFYGGEPLLNFDGIRFAVSYAEKSFDSKRLHFSLTTNGLLIKSKIVEDFLVEHQFNVLVSVDGPEAFHDRYRKDIRGEGTFSRIYQNLMDFKNRYPDYYEKHVGYAVTLAPPYDIAKVKEFFEASDLKTQAPVLVNFVDPDNSLFLESFSEEDRMAYNKQLDELWSKEKAKWLEGAYSVFLDNLYYRDLFVFHKRIQGETGDVLYPGGMCIPGFERTFVDTNGSISPCEKVHYHLVVGNVYDGFDYEIVERAIREIVKAREKCRECPLAKSCGVCFNGVFVRGRFSPEKFDVRCRANELKYKRLLRRYIEIYEANPDFFEIVKEGV
ncbi:MAG TPA: radical SAM protein [Candidatus Hydrothermia bacterium]|mgnify:CR=1 FL=1|nr:radical SAM protein [Candidatus Hydrothermia bacterium]